MAWPGWRYPWAGIPGIQEQLLNERTDMIQNALQIVQNNPEPAHPAPPHAVEITIRKTIHKSSNAAEAGTRKG